MPSSVETTSPAGLSRRGLVVEAVTAAAMVMTLALVLDPTAPGRGTSHPHLLWTVVLVLAAQYGVRGLISSLLACLGMLALASIFVGEDPYWLVERATDSSELLAFTGAIAVAWVAGGHARRKAALASAHLESAAEAAEAQSSFNDLRSVADGLVRQIDRAQLSVSYLRSLAERIEGPDPLAGADAALELAVSRIGARVGCVLLHDGTRLRLYAHRGAWSADRAAPPEVFDDRTADLAFKQGRAVTALELRTLHELDSDVAAPIVGKDGKPRGVIVVRGLSFDLELACIEEYERTVADLLAIARWIGRSFDAVATTPAPASASRTSYTYSYRAGERRDVFALRRLPANGGDEDAA